LVGGGPEWRTIRDQNTFWGERINSKEKTTLKREDSIRVEKRIEGSGVSKYPVRENFTMLFEQGKKAEGLNPAGPCWRGG